LIFENAPVDDVGEASFQCSSCLGRGLAFRYLAEVVDAAGPGVAGLADGDDVQGGVELAIACGVEAVSAALAVVSIRRCK